MRVWKQYSVAFAFQLYDTVVPTGVGVYREKLRLNLRLIRCPHRRGGVPDIHAVIEVKSLEPSPLHQFMMLVGQYLVYRAALDYIGDTTPLYVAITEADHQMMIEQPLGLGVIRDRLKEPNSICHFRPRLKRRL